MGRPLAARSIVATGRPSTPSVQARRRASVVRPEPGGPRARAAWPGPSARDLLEQRVRRRVEAQHGPRRPRRRGTRRKARRAPQRARELVDAGVARGRRGLGRARGDPREREPRLVRQLVARGARCASPSVAPSAYTSARTVSGSPSKSSGAAYFGVRPSRRACRLRARAPRARGRPACRARSSPTMMFAGLMSPWRRPDRCRTVSWSAALAMGSSHDRSRASSSCRTSSRLRPSTSSRTMYRRRSRSAPNATMRGTPSPSRPLSATASCTSASISASPASRDRTFSASTRSATRSRTAQTSPPPPDPRLRIGSYRGGKTSAGTSASSGIGHSVPRRPGPLLAFFSGAADSSVFSRP